MAAHFHFRSATRSDLPMLQRWRETPEVLPWWGAWQHSEAEFQEHLDQPAMKLWIVSVDGLPFAFVQDYACHAWEDHPFAYLPPGSRGMDLYIGEPSLLDRGHGTALLRQHCAKLFAAGVPAIGADPNPDNFRARSAFRKAGFEEVSGPVDTRWGRAILMERWPTDSLPDAG